MVEREGYWKESIRSELFNFTHYKNDVVISRPNQSAPMSFSPGTTRGKCKELSYKSRRNLAFVASNTDVQFNGMVTMTYHPDAAPRTGQEAKKHLNAFLQKYRRAGASFLWFMEFQKNTSVHFHMLTSHILCDVSKRIKMGVHYESSSDESTRWTAIVRKGIVSTQESEDALQKMDGASVRVEYLKSKDGAGRYVSKYAYKTYQKIVPDNFSDTGRFWGCTKDVKPTARHKVEGTLPDGMKYYYIAVKNKDDEIIDYALYPYRIQFGAAKADNIKN